MAPEGFLDEQAVQRRVEELLEKYNQRPKTRGDSPGSEDGDHPLVGERDGEGDIEEEAVAGGSGVR